jgi:hypothetical protein
LALAYHWLFFLDKFNVRQLAEAVDNALNMDDFDEQGKTFLVYLKILEQMIWTTNAFCDQQFTAVNLTSESVHQILQIVAKFRSNLFQIV